MPEYRVECLCGHRYQGSYSTLADAITAAKVREVPPQGEHSHALIFQGDGIAAIITHDGHEVLQCSTPDSTISMDNDAGERQEMT